MSRDDDSKNKLWNITHKGDKGVSSTLVFRIPAVFWSKYSDEAI